MQNPKPRKPFAIFPASRLAAVVGLAGLILALGSPVAQAHPGPHRHLHGNTVVVQRNVVVDPAPVRNLVARTVGEVVTVLPASHIRVSFQGRTWFVDDGVFYSRHPRGYVVVQPVAGLRLASLPRGYTTVRSGRTVHYRYRGITYRRVNNYFVVV